MQLCQCERPVRVWNVLCSTMVRHWVCLHELLYRLKSVGGECKIDDHGRVFSIGGCGGRDGYDAGILLVLRWSGVLHGLRGVKGCM